MRLITSNAARITVASLFVLCALMIFAATNEKIASRIDYGTFIGTKCYIEDNNDIIYAKVHGFVDGTLRERSVKLSQWPQEIFPGDKVRIFTTDKGETTLEKIIPGWGP